MLRAEDLYHTGIVVEDLCKALEQLSARTGHRFAEPMAFEMTLRTPGGESTVELRACYSKGPGALIEVIEAVPGTLWTPVAGSGLHHLGYWVDDMDAESAALSATGVPLEAAGLGPEGTVLFAYHYDGGGVRLELVDRLMKPVIDEWTTPESMPESA